MIQANRWLVGYISSALIAGASLWEGTKYYAYKDLTGIPTVCMGHTGNGIIVGRKYSPQECSAFLRSDLKTHADGVLNCITKPLKENEFNAFVLFAYNIGVANACSSRAFTQFNAGNIEAACKAMASTPEGVPVWSYVNHGTVYVQGLQNRRIYERDMCLGGSDV